MSNYNCSECGKLFMTANGLKRHEKIHASSSTTHCKECDEHVKTSDFGYHLRTNKHRTNSGIPSTISDKLKVSNSDFRERIEIYTLTNEKEGILFPQEFFNDVADIIINLLKECLAKHIVYKFNMELMCDYIKMDEEDAIVTSIAHISKMKIVTIEHDIMEMYKSQSDEICNKMSEFQERDSGWTLVNIKSIEININQASLIRGSQYISLPTVLAQTRSCINIMNNDIYCFKWCIISALHSARDLTPRQRINCSSYNIFNIPEEEIIVGNNKLNFKNMEFPLKLRDVKKFEYQNKEISVNVFGFESNVIVGPYYITKEEKSKHINLILLTKNGKSHFVLINDLSK